jgi:hypothetical protein
MNRDNESERFARYRPCLAIVLAAGLALRAGCALGSGLWLDEFQSFWILSGDGMTSVLDRCSAQMTQFPLFYLINRAIVSLCGPAEWSLRLAPVLYGGASIAAIFFLVRRLFGPLVATLSATILALSTAQINFGAWCRPYSLMVLLGVVSTLCYLRWYNRPCLGRLVLYVLTSVLLGYTHLLALLLLPAHTLHLVLTGRFRAHFPAFAAGQFLAGILLLPMAPQVMALADNSVSFTYRALSPPVFLDIVNTYAEAGAQMIVATAILLLGFAGIFGRRGKGGAAKKRHRDSRSAWLLVGAMIAACLGLPLLVYFTTGTSVFSDARYFALLGIPFAIVSARLCVAAAEFGFRPAAMKRVWLVPLAYCLIFLPLARLLHVEDFVWTKPIAGWGEAVGDCRAGDLLQPSPFEDWRGAVDDLNRSARDGESVYIFTAYVESNFDRFAADPGLREYLAGPLGSFYLKKDLNLRILPADPFNTMHQSAWRHFLLREKGQFWMLGRNWPGFRAEVDWIAGQAPRRFRAGPLPGREEGYAGDLVLLQCTLATGRKGGRE